MIKYSNKLKLSYKAYKDKVIFVDGVEYTRDEMNEIRHLSDVELLKIHSVKQIFKPCEIQQTRCF